MLKCSEISQLVASDEIEDFGFMKRVEMKFHLFMCGHCRNYVAQIRSIGRGARDLATEGEPDSTNLARMEKKICDCICKDLPDTD
jgi:hypothetical protein